MVDEDLFGVFESNCKTADVERQFWRSCGVSPYWRQTFTAIYIFIQRVGFHEYPCHFMFSTSTADRGFYLGNDVISSRGLCNVHSIRRVLYVTTTLMPTLFRTMVTRAFVLYS